MADPLFRSEFLKARARPDFGALTLTPQRAVRITAVCSLSIIVLLVTLLSWLPYTRTETAVGFMIRDADAFAVTSAFQDNVRVDSLLVKGGEVVFPGKPLLVVIPPLTNAEIANEPSSNSLAVLTELPAENGGDRGPSIATLVSTQRGYMDKFLVLPGDYVAPGQPIALLRRQQGRIVFRVLATSRTVAFLREGRQVFIRVEAFPFQRFGSVPGHVVGLSESSLSPHQVASMFGIQPPRQNSFIVDVAVDDPSAIGGSQALKPGMSAFVDFPLEETSVLKWIFSSILRRGNSNGSQ